MKQSFKNKEPKQRLNYIILSDKEIYFLKMRYTQFSRIIKAVF